MTCDYCDEGNIAEAGWHMFLDPYLGSYRVPCAIDPPAIEEAAAL